MPRSRIREFFEAPGGHGLPTVTYGHLGDGNLHVNLLAAGATDPRELERQLQTLFGLCVGLGGALSGEHGIGLAKRDAFLRFTDPYQVEGLRGHQAGAGSRRASSTREKCSECTRLGHE